MEAVAADPFDGEVLERAQELGLRRKRQVGHLVEKQRSAVGALELAAAPAYTGGSPVLDAEKLGFEQRLDKGRAIHRHERPASARADLVNLPGNQLLAGAAFAVDERDEVRRCHALDALADRLHNRTRSDQRSRAVSSHARSENKRHAMW